MVGFLVSMLVDYLLICKIWNIPSLLSSQFSNSFWVDLNHKLLLRFSVPVNTLIYKPMLVVIARYALAIAKIWNVQRVLISGTTKVHASFFLVCPLPNPSLSQTRWIMPRHILVLPIVDFGLCSHLGHCVAWNFKISILWALKFSKIQELKKKKGYGPICKGTRESKLLFVHMLGLASFIWQAWCPILPW